MNWRRGLYRSWIAGSIIWVVFVIWAWPPATYVLCSVRPTQAWVDETRHAGHTDQEIIAFLVKQDSQAHQDPVWWMVGALVVVSLAPPLLLLAVGEVIAWIRRGFALRI
jgi:hypothetical protein